MVTACIYTLLHVYIVRASYERKVPHSGLQQPFSTSTRVSRSPFYLSISLSFFRSQSLWNTDAVHYFQLIELNQSINFQFSRTISDKYSFFFGYACRLGSPIKNHFKWHKYAFHAHLLFSPQNVHLYIFFYIEMYQLIFILSLKSACICVAILWIVSKRKTHPK